MDLNKRLLSAIHGLTKRITFLSTATAYERVASIIIYLGQRYGQKQSNCIIIKEKFTHEDLASLTGLTRERVSVEMSTLKSEGAITYKNRRIIILKPNSLKLTP